MRRQGRPSADNKAKCFVGVYANRPSNRKLPIGTGRRISNGAADRPDCYKGVCVKIFEEASKTSNVTHSKTYRNLYERVCSEENLLHAFRKAKRGKSKKWYVLKFEANLQKELQMLCKELLEGTYAPSPLKRFVIRDPKSRVIHASHFRDRVVHHALCNILEPIFDRRFIYDSYASRKGKGTHAALDRFDYFVRKVTRNGRLLWGGGPPERQ